MQELIGSWVTGARLKHAVVPGTVLCEGRDLGRRSHLQRRGGLGRGRAGIGFDVAGVEVVVNWGLQVAVTMVTQAYGACRQGQKRRWYLEWLVGQGRGSDAE